jgi:hypothetical protein
LIEYSGICSTSLLLTSDVPHFLRFSVINYSISN